MAAHQRDRVVKYPRVPVSVLNSSPGPVGPGELGLSLDRFLSLPQGHREQGGAPAFFLRHVLTRVKTASPPRSGALNKATWSKRAEPHGLRRSLARRLDSPNLHQMSQVFRQDV